MANAKIILTLDTRESGMDAVTAVTETEEDSADGTDFVEYVNRQALKFRSELAAANDGRDVGVEFPPERIERVGRVELSPLGAVLSSTDLGQGELLARLDRIIELLEGRTDEGVSVGGVATALGQLTERYEADRTQLMVGLTDVEGRLRELEIELRGKRSGGRA